MARAKLPLAPRALYAVFKDLRKAAADDRPLVVAGAPQLAGVLRRELSRGAAPGAVRGPEVLERAAVLVCVLAGAPGEDDRRALRAARRARVPVVCVLAEPAGDVHVPHVLAADVVRVPPGSGFPLEEIAEAVANRLGEAGSSLAARVPVLRRAVSEALVARFARQNAVIGAAVFVPGADLPALTLNQLRLVLRLAVAHGLPLDAERLPEVAGVLAGALGFRALARQLLGVAPGLGWALKGAVAYGGTRAVGEAALRLFEARSKTAADAV